MTARNIPIIPEETARFCEEILRLSIEGKPHPLTDAPVTRDQAWHAKDLLKLYQSQQRFSEADVDRYMKMGRPSENVRNLAALTPDELERKRAAMAATTA